MNDHSEPSHLFSETIYFFLIIYLFLTWKIITLWCVNFCCTTTWISYMYAAAAKSLQSCLTLCDPMDYNLPGFSVHGILQARTLEWVAISFSSTWKWKVKVKSLSRVWLWATPWTAAHQAPPSMGFSGQQYWSGVPLPSPAICIRVPISPPSWACTLPFLKGCLNYSLYFTKEEKKKKNGS